MRIKERVTVTLDREIVVQAKRMAHRQGKSLSGFVEASLEASLRPLPKVAGSFVHRWAGKFSVRDDDQTDQRLVALKAKHRLG